MRHWVGIVYIKNNQILMAREEGSDVFKLPGGTIEEGESVIDGLRREIKEETGIELSISDNAKPWQEIELVVVDSQIHFSVFLVEETLGDANPGAEIEELIFINPKIDGEKQRKYGELANRYIFPLLFREGRLK